MNNETPKVSELVRTAPERIFLQIADEDYSDEPFPHNSEDQVTWCATSCVECEVEYVRADLAVEQRAALLEALERVLLTVEHAYHTSPDTDGSLWADVMLCRNAIALAQ